MGLSEERVGVADVRGPDGGGGLSLLASSTDRGCWSRRRMHFARLLDVQQCCKCTGVTGSEEDIVFGRAIVHFSR